MKEHKSLLIGIGLFFVVVLLGIVGYFTWINMAYVDTLHAVVAGDVSRVLAPASGRVEELLVDEGYAVEPDEIVLTLRVMDTSTGQRLLFPIRATTGGTVAELTVNVGDTVGAGQTVMTIVDPEGVWVEAQVSESRIAQVRVGQPVRIRVRQRAVRRTVWGHVVEIGQYTSGMSAGGFGGLGSGAIEVPVKIKIATEGFRLYQGMTADLRIKITPRIW